ncbi:MAG TPA: oxygenase MpaB family protein, partial [Solirubrobacteraceae bacterium]|nr:oxygenase MpaB family protein [Solirubrobacteraceae bacterium]
LDDLERSRRDMLDGARLHVSRWARDRARKIVLEPPVPLMAQPLLQTVNFITIALLPDDIREQLRVFVGASDDRAEGARHWRRCLRQAGDPAAAPRAAAPRPGGARLVIPGWLGRPSARPSASNATSRTSVVANSVCG